MDLRKQFAWPYALRRFRDGDASAFARLVNLHAPAELHDEISALLATAAPRRRGRPARIGQASADLARDLFTTMTTRKSDGGDGWSDTRARAHLASLFGVTEDTIRNVVERRRTYANKPQ